MATEDWRDIVRADIAALPDRRGTEDAEATKVTADLLPGAYSIIREAAKVRRVSLSAYVRRAVLALACYDLGLPYSDAMRADSRITNMSGFPISDPDGTRFGAWEIAALKEGEPDGR